MTGKLCVFSRVVNLVNSAQNPARNLHSCRGPSGAAMLANASADAEAAPSPARSSPRQLWQQASSNATVRGEIYEKCTRNSDSPSSRLF